jgi:anti-anti-sigma factor
MTVESDVLVDRLDGRMSGEIDMATAPTAEADLLALALARPTDRTTLALDCAGLTFIDSAGIHMLDHVATRSGMQVQLDNLPTSCRRIFEILDRCDDFGIPPAHD